MVLRIGEPRTFAGTGRQGYAGDGGPATQAQLSAAVRREMAKSETPEGVTTRFARVEERFERLCEVQAGRVQGFWSRSAAERLADLLPDVAAAIGSECHVVFITAYNQYALAAFEAKALMAANSPTISIPRYRASRKGSMSSGTPGLTIIRSAARKSSDRWVPSTRRQPFSSSSSRAGMAAQLGNHPELSSAFRLPPTA